MAGKKLRNHPKEQKLQVIRDHLLKKKPVSEVCSAYEIQPSQYYGWQKLLLEHGTLDGNRAKASNAELRNAQKRIALLESKLRKKDEVLSELMEEHITLKQTICGES